ncbi:MAG TPA: hypothetical protein PKL29_09540, partial [Methanothrix sp.]|nr:hypothetical protein [Methanothrix sp.]
HGKGGIYINRLTGAICMMAILLIIALSGCTEKQPADDLTSQASNETAATGKSSVADMQSANGSHFLEDFNSINNPYKETLFATGQARRNESIKDYENLTGALAAFQQKYGDAAPPEIKSDKQFSQDMTNVSAIVSSVKDDIYEGNLTEAHARLEGVRPIFQKILTRNNLMPLSVALVDFHDVMETVLAAASNKDAKGVMEAYSKADGRLKSVEAISNDPGIKAIRANLDGIESLAKENKTDELPAKAAELKASYVKVYLTTA